MKYKSLLLLFSVLLFQSITAQKIVFKDENLKLALLDLDYDFNKDNEIEISEIDTVSKLTIRDRSIKQLDDLIYFKNLKIINAMSNQITNLDVFFDNSMIEEIYVGENNLGKKLVLKNLKNLTGLYVFRNGLEEINLIDTNNIQSLYIQGNLFETIEFKNLSKLNTLQLTDNEKLKVIDVSNNKKLKQLYLINTAISELDMTNNLFLKILYVEKGVKIKKNDKQSKFKPMPIIQSK